MRALPEQGPQVTNLLMLAPQVQGLPEQGPLTAAPLALNLPLESRPSDHTMVREERMLPSVSAPQEMPPLFLCP